MVSLRAARHTATDFSDPDVLTNLGNPALRLGNDDAHRRSKALHDRVGQFAASFDAVLKDAEIERRRKIGTKTRPHHDDLFAASRNAPFYHQRVLRAAGRRPTRDGPLHRNHTPRIRCPKSAYAFQIIPKMRFPSSAGDHSNQSDTPNRRRFVSCWGAPRVCLRLWGSITRPKPVSCGDRPPGVIAEVSLRLLYLIFSQLLTWLNTAPPRPVIQRHRAPRPTPRGRRTPQNLPQAPPRLGRPSTARRTHPTPARGDTRTSRGHTGHGPALAPPSGVQQVDLPEPLRAPHLSTRRSPR